MIGFKSSRQALQRLGDYEVLDRIGEGSMAEVYKGRHLPSGRVVAIKVLRPEMTSDPRQLKRFEQEFAAAHRCRHPHAVEVLECAREGAAHYLVMEYVDGPSLWDHIARAGRLPEAEAVRLLVQVAEALHEAHGLGLIHRDVKPDNILLTADGQAKLTDLGLVKDLDNDLDLTRTRKGLGTPNFMAVEQFADAKHADARCDIYSLGATLYMAVTGKLPFEGHGVASVLAKKVKNDLTPARRLVRGLSEQTDRVIRRSVHADPNERPRTCLEFIAELTGGTSTRATVRAAPAKDQSAPPPGAAGPLTRERRAAVRYSCELGGLCEPPEAEAEFRWFASVADVSVRGIGLVVNRRFEPGTVLDIELAATRDSRSRSLQAHVVRLTRRAGGKWLLGCALTRKLSEADVREIST